MSRLRRASHALRQIASPLFFGTIFAKLQGHFPSLSSYETTLIVGELEDCADVDDKISLYSFKLESEEDSWRLDFIRWDPERRGFRFVVKGVVKAAEEDGGVSSEE